MILSPPRLVCPQSRHKGRACLREVVTHFMPIQTPMSLNATPALGTIIGAKLCHAIALSRLNISYVDGTPVVQKG